MCYKNRNLLKTLLKKNILQKYDFINNYLSNQIRIRHIPGQIMKPLKSKWQVAQSNLQVDT